MGVFDAKPSYRVASAREDMLRAVNLPFNGWRAFGEEFQQGAMDSFGLGTVLRELQTPDLNARDALGGDSINGIPLDPLNLFKLNEQPRSLTEDEYKSSAFFRDTVPWQKGLTADRAAALAEFADRRAMRQHFSREQPIAAFFGQFFGQAMDPINYVSVFGAAASAAAVARFGNIGGRLLLGASDAAINTAAFGLLTADIRGKLGDDVSFAAIGTEIAMSALIGGAFGGGMALMGRGMGAARERIGARERVAIGQAREALATAANRQKAAATLNGQIDALATTGTTDMTPNGMAAVNDVVQQIERRVTAATALDAQTRHVTGTQPTEVVIAPSGRRVSVQQEVVELDSLIHAQGALQVRNRNTAASAAQIEDIGANLDPARMMANIDGSQGAPLVGKDNIVDSGNGRIAGIRRAYEAYPERAQSYRDHLAAQGYDVANMQRPVLISRRMTDLDETARAQFNAELNGRTTASLGAVEIAQMDRAALTENVMDAHAPGPVTSASNRAFVQRFMAELGINDRQALLTEDGKSLSSDGVRRIENALFAAAYGDMDPSAVRRFTEGVDDNTRAIVGAMSDVAGSWTKMRRAAKNGTIPIHLDQTKELTEALRLIGGWREQAAREGRPVGKVIAEGMAQMDLLTGEIRPEVQVFIRSFYTSDAFTRAQGREALAGQFADLIESGYELGRPSLFGDAMPEVSALQVLENAVRRNAETDLRPTGDALSRAEENGSADIEPAPGADRGLDRQSDEAGAEALAEADIFSHGADLGERPMSSADIADTMRERFENAGRPADEAEAAAGMLSTFYSTMAARTGRSINDLLKIAPLPEVRRGGQPDMSAQALAQSQPGNPAFDRWFGDSKVVDAEGKPLVVYHSTSAPDFDKFRRRTGDIGMHFGTVGQAEDRANFMRGAKGGDGAAPREGERMIPVYLSIKRPLRLRDAGAWNADNLAFQLRDLFPEDAERIKRLKSTKDIREFIRSKGFDGIVYKNTGEANDPARMAELRTEAEAAREALTAAQKARKRPLNSFDKDDQATPEYQRYSAAEKAAREFREGEGSADSYIAFEPTQVKSTFNRGTFDPNDPRILYQVGVDQARRIDMPVDLPKGAEFAKAVENTPGAEVTPDGLLIDLVRYQKPEQEGDESVRTGVFYLPTGSKDARHFKGEGAVRGAYGGRVEIKGKTLLKRPMFVKGSVGGKAPEAAFDAIRGKGAYAKLEKSIMQAINGRGLNRIDAGIWEDEIVPQLLRENGADENMAWHIVQNSKQGNQLRYALQENIIAHAVREAGYDAVIGYGKGRGDKGEFISEVFDVREVDYPVPGDTGAVRLHDSFRERSDPRTLFQPDSRVSITEFEQGARGSIEFGSDGRSVMSMFDAADASTALHESAHWFLQMFRSFADRADAPAEIRADWDRVRAWWTENADAVAADSPTGATGDDVRRLMETGTSGNRLVDIGIEVGMQEQWARGFEAYLREGVAPNEGLRGIFDQFKRWLTSIYRQALDLNVNINDDIRGVFDRLLAQQQGDLVPNSTAPKPDPVPDGLDAAAAAVRTPADPLKLGAQYGLDDAGGFAEEADIEALKAQKLITPEDQAMLDEADQLVADAEAYGKTLETAAWCMR